MRRTSRRRRTLAVIAVLLALPLAGCGGSDESTPSDEELAQIAAEINKTVPNIGLGEASPPPPDADSWKTDFSRQLVPLEEFQSGGPRKDGIPAIDAPRFSRAEVVDWLESREPVIAVTVGDETRGYPIQILMWHEIANDRIGDVPVAVTFCPLCNTAIVFDRRLDGDTLDFGTTGKLRESDLVMYDRQTESWWQQFSGEALVGALVGRKLKQLPARIVSWQEFRSEHPESLVLNLDTGFTRTYGVNPYVGYDGVDSSPLFAVRNEDDDRLPPKERVVYVEIGDGALAFPYSSLVEETEIARAVDGRILVVRWRPGVASALDTAGIAEGRDIGSAEVLLDGAPVAFSEPFWFAVAAFRPDIEIVDE